MSRVGKKPILIPDGVEVKIEGQKAAVKGPKGEIVRQFSPKAKIVLEGKSLSVSSLEEGKESRAIWGSVRAILNNSVLGVTKGF
ncbi:MAG: 50S ribosomal protein L6 [Candidatus Nealsonbacteria bacterium]|nr:50S ribosomal protein L6 [Candidatus Nealsonbacteria bacterium]